MSYSKYLTNPEKQEFEYAKQVFAEFLDDFKARGLLRKGTPHNQRERLSRMLRQSRQFGQAFNTMFNIFNDKDRVEAFAARNKVDGVDEKILTGAVLSQTIGLFLYNIETVFRTSLIFFLEEKQGLRKKMELGRLFKTIKKISPQIGLRLESLIDSELRNALAHGAFWFEAGGKGYLAQNSHLENPKSLDFAEFLIRGKKQNIAAHAFIEVLMEKANQDYFK